MSPEKHLWHHSNATTSRDFRRNVPIATSFAAQVIVDDRRLSVIIGDISSVGVLVKGDAPLALGAKVRLRAIGRDEVARVMWVHDGLFSISFTHPVSPLAIARDNTSFFRDMHTWSGDTILASQPWENWSIVP
ncbi:PilZ domain-containing protein [Sphingomonas sanxanigenens]|uniref:PilZ domain-containing protein n=1 Tax=Sphingomonas sanxanigenens TaxID=397260 RepID=UPI0013011D41|nr:PilZ domain-containing protein [Sphingomonas sanxanigenens]